VKTYIGRQPKLAAWAEDNFPEGFTVFALPEARRKSTTFRKSHQPLLQKKIQRPLF